MHKNGFTLAEVLVTLMILGVIAAITVPSLIAKYQEKATVTKVKNTFSIFSQATLRAIAENGYPNTWDVGTGNNTNGAQKLYNIYKPYLLKVKDCDISSKCFAKNYTAMFSSQLFIARPDSNIQYAKGKLQNGVSFILYSDDE